MKSHRDWRKIIHTTLGDNLSLADEERFLDEIVIRIQCDAGNDVQLKALRQIKLTCLTAMDGQKALAHIIRLCIDAGVKEHMDELQKTAND